MKSNLREKGKTAIYRPLLHNTLRADLNKKSVKFMFSKKTTQTDEIFTVDLTFTTYCQIENEDFVNFCGLLKKHEL